MSYSLDTADNPNEVIGASLISNDPVSTCLLEPGNVTSISVSAHDWHVGNSSYSKQGSRNEGNLIRVKKCQENDINPAKLLSVGLLNCRSVNNKTMSVKDFIVDNDFDLFCITESFLEPDPTFIDNFRNNDVLPTDTCKHKHIIRELVPSGYKLLHFPMFSLGGGNAMIYKSSLQIKPQSVCTNILSFEYMEVLLKSCGEWIRLVLVYRSPPSD